MKSIVVAIDGYSGTGKSSTAKSVASRLKYNYIDSGAMYRSAALYFLDHNIDLSSDEQIRNSLDQIEIFFRFKEEASKSEIYLNGRCVEDQIRKPEVNEMVSTVAAISSVRRKMVDIQHRLGEKKRIVMDGRDIGTVVFPNAELKVFMLADINVRAERRLLELQNMGIPADIKEVMSNLEERDFKDSTRQDSPLRKAENAFEIDTTHLTFAEQVDLIVKKAEELINAS